MLDPKSLSVVVALAEIGSATGAARRLGISQPGVNYHVNKLEEALDTKLFSRCPTGLLPTEEGEALVQRARTILADLERLEKDVRRRGSEENRTIRVTSACFTNYHWLPTVLQAYRAKHGTVHVELDVDPSRRPFESLDRGALDVALTTLPPDGPAFTRHELFDDEIVAVVHPEHPLATKSHVEAGDFVDESVAVFDRRQSDLFNLALVPAGVTPRDVSDVPVTEAILELVRAGLAVSAMASWAAWPDLEQGTLTAVPIGKEGLHRTWWAVVSARRPTSSSVAAFVEVLKHSSVRPIP